MHTHGVHVLDGTNDDDVVGEIADHLEFVFLPAQNRLFDQTLMDWRQVEPTTQDVHQFFAVIGQAAA